ncbi:sigma-70 family RNA polymerase sigma factor [Streptomyces coeruleorubidus]|uniref:sigma-70 family RNA polymerase sigma factor n=1 Tax=Streptomyces coeruleorubidus TaxID=116188 RepID=UPI0036FBEC54
MEASRERDAALVEAARQGALWAQDELVAAYLPLVYNIVGRALNGDADVDDVVQETMLRALGGLGSLRDPEQFRPWLVAITMNRIRSHWNTRQAAPAVAGLQDLHDVADPGADFVDLTIVQLGLQGQRREVAEATRWLDDADRELLALWWLEAAGELTRGEVAAALRLSPQHTAVRVQRMKAHLETARLVVRALAAVPRCVLLDDGLGLWDGVPSALWRKRIARHARDCTLCTRLQAGLLPAEKLLVGLGLVASAGALSGLAGLASVGDDGLPAQNAAFETGVQTGTGGPSDLAVHTDQGSPGEWAQHSGKAAPGADGRHPAVGADSIVLGAPGSGNPPGRRSLRIRRRIPRRRRAAVAAAVTLITAGGTGATMAILSPDTGHQPARAVNTAEGEPESATGSSTPTPTASPTKSATAGSTASPSSSPATSPPPTGAGPTRQTAPPTRASSPKPTIKTTTPAPSLTSRLIALLNERRRALGLPEVRESTQQVQAAQACADKNAARQPSPSEHCGYEVLYWSPSNSATPEEMMETWFNSPGHKAALTHPSSRNAGAGSAVGPSGLISALNIDY